MAFDDVRMPVDWSYGAQVGPGFRTLVVVGDSGKESRIARRSTPLRRFDISYALRQFHNTARVMADVRAFYYARQGALNGFRVRDWSDFTSKADGVSANGIAAPADQIIGIGDGTQTQFQLVKVYSDSSGNKFTVAITKPTDFPDKQLDTAAGVRIFQDTNQSTPGTTFTVDYSTGVVLFVGGAPLNGVIIGASYEYDIACRFDEAADGWLSSAIDEFNRETLSSVPLIELDDGGIAVDDRFYFGGAEQLDLAIDVALSVLNKRFLKCINPAVGGKLFLPPIGDVVAGGTWFIIQNVTGNAIALRDSGDTQTYVSIAGGSIVHVYAAIGSSGLDWSIFS